MKIEQAIFTCGYFWSAQYQFEHVKGVVKTTVGISTTMTKPVTNRTAIFGSGKKFQA